MPRRPAKQRFDPQSLDATLATILTEARGTASRINSHEQFVKEQFARQALVMEEIRAQVTATNGRVTKIEDWRDRLKWWLRGAAATGGLAGTILGYFAQRLYGGNQ